MWAWETTRKIITNLTEGASRKQLRDAEALYGLLKDEMSGILAKVDKPLNVEGKTPFVILMVGVNGVGKPPPSANWRVSLNSRANRSCWRRGIPSVRQRWSSSGVGPAQ